LEKIYVWSGRPLRLVEIELRDQVAQFRTQVLAQLLELADELASPPGKIGELVGTEDKKRNHANDQPVQRRERTIERHVPSLRPFDPTDRRTRVQTEAPGPLRLSTSAADLGSQISTAGVVPTRSCKPESEISSRRLHRRPRARTGWRRR